MATPIRICGDLDTADVDLVQMVVADSAGRELLRTIVASRTTGGDLALPLDTEIPLFDGNGFVSAEARSAGLLAARHTVRVRDLSAAEPLDFPLENACLRFDCGEGETCVGGVCETAKVPELSPSCP